MSVQQGARVAIGLLAVIIGLIGLVVPGLPGFIFLIAAVVLLPRDVPMVRRAVTGAFRRWPTIRRMIPRRFRRRVAPKPS